MFFYCWNAFLQNFRFSATSKSPSQILEQHTMDFENDLWSLGIVFHYVFAIQNLFCPGISVKQTILTQKFNYFSVWDRAKGIFSNCLQAKQQMNQSQNQLQKHLLKFLIRKWLSSFAICSKLERNHSQLRKFQIN